MAKHLLSENKLGILALVLFASGCSGSGSTGGAEAARTFHDAIIRGHRKLSLASEKFGPAFVKALKGGPQDVDDFKKAFEEWQTVFNSMKADTKDLAVPADDLAKEVDA